MRISSGTRLALLTAVVSSASACLPSTAAAASPCDRACLRTTLDAYLNAVIKHDPAAAPLMIGFRQTENAIVVRPGNGLWKSMTGLGPMQRRYLDAVTGQAAYFGIIKEGDAQAVVTVRIKVDDRKISEAEWIVARAGEFGPNGPNGNVFNAPGGDCAAGLENFNASIVAARRYPLVDEEAQAVLALAVFLRKPGSPTRRNMFSEWFFIDNARIRLVYAAMFYPPPDQPVPNWPPYDGNFPLPAELAPPAAAPAKK
jgi:hypothetical protein